MEVDDGGQIENKKKKEEKEEESFQPVELLECFTNLTEPQSIEYSCSNCQEKTLALKSTRFRSFPQVLVLNANRFQLENWVPKKVNVPLLFDPKEVDLSQFIGKGLQEGEKELPQDDQAQKGTLSSLFTSLLPQADVEWYNVRTGPIEHEFDQTSIDQLTGMGFPEIRAKRALLKTGNSGAEPAMNWLFEHMDDQGKSITTP
jgi:ubiquitin carboxyl-terminal hydrolase 5/13